MKVNLKCFADLAERYTCDYHAPTAMDVADGATVENVMTASGIPAEDVKIVFVNGRITGPGQALHEGDRVTLVPATGGM